MRLYGQTTGYLTTEWAFYMPWDAKGVHITYVFVYNHEVKTRDKWFVMIFSV